MNEFSIKIHPQNGSYKSISALSWENIPEFAILTGKNGSGKTQLLEILAYKFSGAIPSGLPYLPVEVTTAGFFFSPDEIGYIPSGGRFSGGGSSLTALSNIRIQAENEVRQGNQHFRTNIVQTIRIQKLSRMLNRPQDASDDFDFVIDDIDVTSGLSHLFMAYRLKSLEASDLKRPGYDREGRPLGPTPWEVVNQALNVAGFPYEVISPESTPILGVYELRLKDISSATEIAAIDLSSGEKVLLQLVLWLFTAGKEGLFPKLLLLDEPDAHLHPSMTTQFLDVISEVLVKKYGVRVIITTHSPSTVALAPEGSVFQLERGASEVKPVSSKEDIIGVLTAGMITVSRVTKFCFVEDEADVLFYETVREILTDFGPSKDKKALNPSPTIAFVPVSIGSGTAKIAGGETVVTKWVEKLDADPLSRTFLGLIDRDASNTPSARIFVIGRYSFENYLLDPMIIYALLLEENTAPAIDGLTISSGDEHLLRQQACSVLQSIADKICAMVEVVEPSIATFSKTVINYTNGASIQVSTWVIDHRGHDLLSIMQKTFGGPKVISPPRLRKALKRCRLIPEELADVLAAIQKA